MVSWTLTVNQPLTPRFADDEPDLAGRPLAGFFVSGLRTPRSSTNRRALRLKVVGGLAQGLEELCPEIGQLLDEPIGVIGLQADVDPARRPEEGPSVIPGRVMGPVGLKEGRVARVVVPDDRVGRSASSIRPALTRVSAIR